MGLKLSMIIVENPDDIENELTILKALGKDTYQFREQTTFLGCQNPRDKSISIGFYNGNIIIGEDSQITGRTLNLLENLDLTVEEEKLCKLFPKSEIISIACHSTVGYHGYSLIRNGKKLRLKRIYDGIPRVEFGKRTIEEEEIYSKSYKKGGGNFWENYDLTGPDVGKAITEQQLMEEFISKFAKRRLGVYIHLVGCEELTMQTPFNRYKNENWWENNI